jgi:hypothetical protein
MCLKVNQRWKLFSSLNKLRKMFKWAEEFPPLVYFKTHFMFQCNILRMQIHLLSSLVTEPFVCTMLTPSLLLDCILDHFTSSQSTAGVVTHTIWIPLRSLALLAMVFLVSFQRNAGIIPSSRLCLLSNSYLSITCNHCPISFHPT